MTSELIHSYSDWPRHRFQILIAYRRSTHAIQSTAIPWQFRLHFLMYLYVFTVVSCIMSSIFKRIRTCTVHTRATEKTTCSSTDDDNDNSVCGTVECTPYARTTIFYLSIPLLVPKSRSADHLNNYQFYILYHTQLPSPSVVVPYVRSDCTLCVGRERPCLWLYIQYSKQW